MNPCPCGYNGHASGKCHCTPDRILRYQERISGPLLDRIDIQVEVPALGVEFMSPDADGEPSASIAGRVAGAAARQQARGEVYRFSRTAFGLVKARTDGRRAVGGTDRGNVAQKEGYAYALDSSGVPVPAPVIRA